jgi:hypothetical protein
LWSGREPLTCQESLRVVDIAVCAVQSPEAVRLITVLGQQLCQLNRRRTCLNDSLGAQLVDQHIAGTKTELEEMCIEWKAFRGGHEMEGIPRRNKLAALDRLLNSSERANVGGSQREKGVEEKLATQK